MKFVYGCLTNNKQILENNLLLPGRLTSQLFTKEGSKSASEGLNILTKKMLETSPDILVYIHQDCILYPDWEKRCEQELLELKDWSLAGLWGLDENGAFAGAVYDIRVWPYLMKSDNLPLKAICLDELCLIVNAKNPIKFDENITGFDLYGLYACCEVISRGETAMIIDVPLMHNCTRPFKFEASDEFKMNFNYIKNKYPDLNVKSVVYDE